MVNRLRIIIIKLWILSRYSKKKIFRLAVVMANSKLFFMSLSFGKQLMAA